MTDTERRLIRAAMYELQVDATWGAGQRLNNAMVYNDMAILRGDAEVAALILKLSAQAPEPYQPAIANLIAELGINESPSVPVPPAPPVVTPPVVQGDFAAQVLAVLAQYDIHLAPGKLGIGLEPKADSPSALQIGGRSLATILGVSNTQHTDGQNPDQQHENTLVIADNDGGMRAVQYGRWFNGQVVRNTDNRKMSIFAFFDSMGNTCINDDTGGRGQDFYIVRDVENRKIILTTYKPGWTIEVRETSQDAPYSAMDVQKL